MNIVFIFLGFLLLVVGGEFIVRSSVALSLKFNISKFVIGMTVVSFATSLPELIVSVNAALNNSPSIAINNVIGSNIANIGLVLGLVSILGKITVDNYFYKRDVVKNKKFKALVTTGPTREYLDPVRFISNESSGKQGYEIALALKRMGVKTTERDALGLPYFSLKKGSHKYMKYVI